MKDLFVLLLCLVTLCIPSSLSSPPPPLLWYHSPSLSPSEYSYSIHDLVPSSGLHSFDLIFCPPLPWQLLSDSSSCAIVGVTLWLFPGCMVWLRSCFMSVGIFPASFKLSLLWWECIQVDTIKEFMNKERLYLHSYLAASYIIGRRAIIRWLMIVI